LRFRRDRFESVRAQPRRDGSPTAGPPTHFALSVPISQEQIAAIAEREAWQSYCCERGAGGFHVMEVWIENTGMVELLPPAFATEYLTLTRRRGVHAP
jgi:hypothetical protein